MTDKPEVMNGESLDIAAQRRAELKQLFPGVFTEIKDANGKIVSSIDFERLKAELGTFSDIYEGRRERYGMEWPGKRDCMKIIQEPSRATLKPCPEESVDWDTTKNLFIEGDNLEVLKLLQKSYYGKVKMIYIDPPYNTGKEFIYPDNYTESLETYLAFAGLLDENKKPTTTMTNSDGRFHTKWLNMMFPRLFLAKNLLADDGVIFISIDDNEVKNLRVLCDEIFGEENFISSIIWQKKYAPSNDATDISPSHDYVLCYLKQRRTNEQGKLISTLNKLPRDDKMNKPYKNPDQDPRGEWRADNYLCNKSADERPNLYYPIINPNTGEEIWPKRTAVWRYSRAQHLKFEQENRVWWGLEGQNKVPAFKRFLSDVGGKMPTTWWSFDEVGHNDEAKKELNKLFNDTDRNFDTPKPIRLIRRMMDLCIQSDDDIVLDFFAGSSTTAHAAMIGTSTGIVPRYIMVQLPEAIEDNQYRTIAEISRERIRRAAKVLSDSIQQDANRKRDLGMKVLKLDSSNFKQWSTSNQETISELQVQLDLSVDNVHRAASQEDILFELLLKAGFEPSESVESINLHGKKVFSVANRALLICLEDQLTAELIDAVIALEPMQFICLDKGFQGNDQLKANTAQAFKARSQASEAEMVFKVV